MAKKVTQGTTLKCTICQAVVTAETYALHIQTTHAAPPPAPPQAAPSIPWAGNATGVWGGQPQGPVPITGAISGKDLAGGHYLKGEDVPDGTTEVRFKIVQFVRDPGGRSKLAAQISETYKKTMFGFNTTNIRAVVAAGYLDMQQIVGKTVVCMMGMAPNPQKGGIPTKALFVARIE